MSKIEDLDALLASLPSLKPPGASKSKISAITQFCVDNIRLDATIAQKLYTHFKKSPPTHKLGYLFVIDSVTRQWREKAKQSGQELSGHSPAHGTYASGVQRVNELMPSLLDETIRVVPQDQKAKVLNLLDIWDRTNTFPTRMLQEYRQRLSNSMAPPVSKTPPGSPPPQLIQALGLGKPVAQQPLPVVPFPAQVNPNDAAGLLRALSGLSAPAQPSPAPPALIPQPQVSAPPQDLNSLLAGLGHAGVAPQQAPVSASPAFPIPFAQPNLPQPQMPPGLPPQLAAFFPQAAAPPVPIPQPVQQAPPPQANPLAELASLIPPHILGNPEQLTQVLTLFNDLARANVPKEQWGPVLAALNPAPSQAAVAPPSPQTWSNTARNDGQRRDRSRSPDYGRNRIQSPGGYDSAGRGNNRTSDNDPYARYRQRSPEQQRNSGGKWISHDQSIPRNHIKVLSRTLFVGGCNTSESDLRSIFSRFGQVQTCIVNLDKRHAFVKMCTRDGAVAAKSGMEELSARDPMMQSKARQTKWGVGFGPRECCDYAVGESIIPISSLTEADLKWALTAEYGGTGGQSIDSNMVMEEPDIEIGAGVSSKAMSKRIGPDGGRGRQGGGGGGNSGRNDGGRNRNNRRNDGGGANGGYGGGANNQAYGQGYGNTNGGGNQGIGGYGSPRPVPQQQQQQQQQETSAYQPPPPVPNFGFSFAVPR